MTDNRNEIEIIIDNAIAAEQEKKEKDRQEGKWSPHLFGKCFRAQFWNRKGEIKSNPPDARALRIFKVGKMFEDFVTGLLNGNYQRQVKDE